MGSKRSKCLSLYNNIGMWVILQADFLWPLPVEGHIIHTKRCVCVCSCVYLILYVHHNTIHISYWWDWATSHTPEKGRSRSYVLSTHFLKKQSVVHLNRIITQCGWIHRQYYDRCLKWHINTHMHTGLSVCPTNTGFWNTPISCALESCRSTLDKKNQIKKYISTKK